MAGRERDRGQPCVDVSRGHALVAGTLAGGRHGGRLAQEGVWDAGIVLGAGFGGLELSATLSDELGDDVEVTLIDRADSFVFGFSKLDVMFGRRMAESRSSLGRHRQAGSALRSDDDPGDPDLRRVETDAGSFDGDVMVVALGADLDPSATPGLIECGHEFYTVAGAFAARDVLEGSAVDVWCRCHLDAVQVSARTERDGAVDG